MDTLKTIGEELKKAESILLFPHIMMDGDGLGSALALCESLRKMGKSSFLVIEDKIADNLAFMAKDQVVFYTECEMEPDICLCIDCGEESRFPKRKELFRSGKKLICIDHHPTSEGIAELNYIDPGAAATGEIVFDLIKENEMPLDEYIAGCLFAAIATDTGNFTYSNTTVRSHEITIELMKEGIDHAAICSAIYENESMAKVLLQSKVMLSAERYADDRFVIAEVTQQMLKECGGRMEDTDGIVADLRSLKGVEIAMLVKETADGDIKVNMRAKQKADVAKIAARHGGGGHVKAAGCTISGADIHEVKETMIKEATEALKQI